MGDQCFPESGEAMIGQSASRMRAYIVACETAQLLNEPRATESDARLAVAQVMLIRALGPARF